MSRSRVGVVIGPVANGSRRGAEPRVCLDPDSRWSLAWLVLTGALAGHVLDEALTDFLSVYNPAVEAVRETAPWLPLPTFTFDVWLGGLVMAVLGLAALAPLARNGRPWMRWLSRAYGFVMALNGLGHLGGSLLLGRWLPGTTSAPFLLAAALFLLRSVPSKERPAGSRRRRGGVVATGQAEGSTAARMRSRRVAMRKGF